MKIEFQKISPSYNIKQIYFNDSLYPVAKNLCFPQKDTVSFGQSGQIPKRAIKFLSELEYPSLAFVDLSKLEGLQNGIDIFKGLNFPQITYIINNLTSINVQRGCNNSCIYCYAESKTPFFMKKNGLLDRINFEDYKNLCSGFKELNKRLGFNAFEHEKSTHQALFHDADASMIYLYDKEGKVYDYADLAKMLNEVTEYKIVFDTAGWNINDKKTQKRMEDLVRKVLCSNEYDFLKFNISVNPFHSIYNKSLELKAQGKRKESERLSEIFKDRLANVIFTFSPLIEKTNSVDKKSMLDFLFRGLFDFTDLQGYCEQDVVYLFDDVVKRVGNLYADDLISGRHRAIRSKKQMDEYFLFLKSKVRHVDMVDLTNKKLLDKLEGISAGERDIAAKHSFNSAEKGLWFRHGLIDTNGKFYMTNYIETYPTDIVLNFKNKGKSTASIAPNLRDPVITKKLIEGLYI